MAKLHTLGLPRIGEKRELKFALEKYWKGELTLDGLHKVASTIRQQNLLKQQHLDFYTVGDFSLYDHVLDTSLMVGNLPRRAYAEKLSIEEAYFRLARGNLASNVSSTSTHCEPIKAGEMTKWFDTNYHYIVPEFSKDTQFCLNADTIINAIKEAKTTVQSDGSNIKPVLVGPVTYLYLGKSVDGTNKFDLLDDLISVYAELLERIAEEGIDWVQIDEPVLVMDLDSGWQHALRKTYYSLNSAPCKILLATYFAPLAENFSLARELPIDGIHIDAVRAPHEVAQLVDWFDTYKVISVGIIDGRNIWKNNIHQSLYFLAPLAEKLGEQLWISGSCSLLHSPISLSNEKEIDSDIKDWLAFSDEKLVELSCLGKVLNNKTDDSLTRYLEGNARALTNRASSSKVHNPKIKDRLASIDTTMSTRQSVFADRQKLQHQRFNLPLFPTTTIGSFPQTQEIRQHRKLFKKGEISAEDYKQFIYQEIKNCIKLQEEIGLDVLVHGEAERNDMVEYFGEQLSGIVFTQFGWVQSYGSRCVKPPIIFGDVERPKPMTVEWIKYAQSLTEKPVKGMLTGPVTMLNWSFVRDDQPRSQTCAQLALAIRDEVLDLEASGIDIIQVDEAALREGLPLKKSQWQSYLTWAIHAFQLCANGVKDETQIHTHMCYSKFNDIFQAIANMDADVITIESSRSDKRLFEAFNDFGYPNDIGPGVYDIHSPNIPDVEDMKSVISLATSSIEAERVWVNPDCGLKTRSWEEVLPSLKHMVYAAQELRG